MPDSPTLRNHLYYRLRENGHDSSFHDPRVDYHQRFLVIDSFLNQNVHPYVNAGAAANDEVQSIFLTDHGPDHIATVLRRISDLLGDKLSELSPYEVYLLLLAAHLHDTGNIFGRKGHERRIQKTLNQLGENILGSDGAEQRMIRSIATAHGGYSDEERTNKDTIGMLPYADVTGGVRPKLLAALLRFGDELADDFTRTSRFLIGSGAIHPASEVFHHYADRLKEVKVYPKERTVALRFDIARSLMCRTFQKGDSSVFLFDEIKDRCLKMHLEMVYCSRFMLPVVDLSRIDVRIAVCDADSDSEPRNEYATELRQMNFTLQQTGYPSAHSTLQSVSPEFHNVTGTELSRELAASGTMLVSPVVRNEEHASQNCYPIPFVSRIKGPSGFSVGLL